MRKLLSLILILSATCLLAFAPGMVLASGGGSWPSAAPSDPDLAAAKSAIEAKDWDRAVTSLNRALVRNPQSADVYNELGYSERNRGNLDAAFRYYEKALTLDPKHRGAHEYIGEAYLMANNLPKAEEHLAALDKICFFPCDEYSELKKSIEEYRQRQKN